MPLLWPHDVKEHMKGIWPALKATLLVALGSGLAVGLGQCGKNTFPSHWFALQQPPPIVPEDGGVAVFGRISYAPGVQDYYERDWDFPVPDVLSVSGEAKFLTSGQRASADEVPLGYKAEITMISDAEYQAKITRLIKQGRKLSDTPRHFPSSVVLQLELVLRDNDGFILQRVDGQPHWLYVDETSTVRGITIDDVSLKNAQATTAIECSIVILRVNHNIDTSSPYDNLPSE